MNLVLGGLVDGMLVVGGLGGSGSGAIVVIQTFRQALVARLLAIPAVTNLIGTRLYPGVLLTSDGFLSRGPALVYDLLSTYRSQRHLGQGLAGSTGTVMARVLLSSMSYTYADCDAISEALWFALEGNSIGTPWGDGTVVILSCLRENNFDMHMLSPDNTSWVYIINDEYEVHYRIPIPVNA